MFPQCITDMSRLYSSSVNVMHIYQFCCQEVNAARSAIITFKIYVLLKYMLLDI